LHESETAVLKATPVALAPYGEQKYKFDALPPIRLAEPFEALRDKSDAALKARGARPKVFLANLGTPADFTARATFAKSWFETGGIEAIDGEGLLPSPGSRPGGAGGGGNSAAEQRPAATLRVDPPPQGERVEADAFAALAA